MKEKLKSLWQKLRSMWSKPPEGRYLTLKEIGYFAGGTLGVSCIVNIIVSLVTVSQIPAIYRIDVIHGAWIYVIASILGLIIQPIYGKALQRTKTKWGKYKPYILFAAPLISAFAILATWAPQNLDKAQSTVYAYCFCTSTLILYNIWNNTYNMMPAVITPNQQERTDVWSPIGLVMGFAPTIINVVKGFIYAHFERQGQIFLAYRYMGFISVALGLVMVMMLLRVKERVYVVEENEDKVGLFEGLKMVLKNKPLMIFSLALILGCMRTTIEVDIETLGRLRYANDHTLSSGYEVFSSLTLFTGFAATPNMILLPWFIRKANNKTILQAWVAMNAIGYAALAIIGLENIPRGTVSAVVITLLRFIALFNALGSLQPLMLSEMYDYQQLKTGKRLEGFIQTFAYSLVLVFTNVGILVMAYVKQGMGFEPRNYYNVLSDVSEELMDIAMRYFNLAAIISAVSAVLMFVVLFFYNLSKKEHERITAELRALNLNTDIEDAEKEREEAPQEDAPAPDAI